MCVCVCMRARASARVCMGVRVCVLTLTVTVPIFIKLMHVGQHFAKNCTEFYENMADSLVTDARC